MPVYAQKTKTKKIEEQFPGLIFPQLKTNYKIHHAVDKTHKNLSTASTIKTEQKH